MSARSAPTARTATLRPVRAAAGRPAVVSLLLALVVAPLAAQAVSGAHAPFPNFESGAVEPLLLSEDGTRLYVLNTPDHRVEVYRTLPELTAAGRFGATDELGGLPGPGAPSEPTPAGGVVTPGAWGAGGSSAEAGAGGGGRGGARGAGGLAVPVLQPLGSVFTGLEPVSMALHPEDPTILFVSNFVSDTVSVVDLATLTVAATLDAGDEPAGLAVADGKLFVACARAPLTPLAAGQTDPGAYEHHVLMVFEAAPPYAPLARIPLGAVKPRDVVAVGDTVYVIPLASGNGTTILDEKKADLAGLDQTLPDATEAPFAVNPILLRDEFVVGGYQRGWYVPATGRIVNDFEYPADVPQLADRDVIPVGAGTLAVGEAGVVTDVGTVLFDVERNPVTGDLWVVNTEARNRERFEPVLKGRAVENRITVVTPGLGVTDVLELAPPRLPREHAQPVQLHFASGAFGELAWVASLGTSSLAVLDAATGALVDEFDVGPLPIGLAVDAARSLLYVLTRGDSTLRAYAIADDHARVGPARPLQYDPEPALVRSGRRHLYEARAAEGHGNRNLSCASCHVFGHYDHSAWDLGDPEGSFSYYYPDALTGTASFPGEIVVSPAVPILNPLKGPMVTQSLRGLIDPDTKDDALLHWRGDRRTIHQFRSAWKGLLGGPGLDPQQVQEFAGFVRSLRYPPNPLQPRDRDYTGLEASGFTKYGMHPTAPATPYASAVPDVFCITCHHGDFTAGDDFTGSRPVASAGSFQQLFQTAQLRQIYEKDFLDVTGFGALHDGAVDGVRGFMDFVVPFAGTPTFGNFTTADKDEVAAFVKAWDSGLAPLVGAQLTAATADAPTRAAWLGLARARAQVQPPELDLIAKGRRTLPGDVDAFRGALYAQDGDGGPWGWRFDTGDFVDDASLEIFIAAGLLDLTFTCVPPGLGERLGLDRDEDGVYDRLEVLAGTSPTAADSDGDGFTDGAEPLLGGDPLAFDAVLPDGAAPVLSDVRALELFHHTATLSLRTDEPAVVTVEIGAAAGVYDGGRFTAPGPARVHDVLLSGLTPGSEVFYRVTAVDTAGNAAGVEDSFDTLPPFFHVEDITLEAAGSGPYTLTATVLVHDQDEQPVPAMPVHAMWSGDIGGQPWEQDATTDGSGRATFTLAPYTPAAPTTVGFSPAYVGTGLPGHPKFVGFGGDTPTFFYDATRNEAAYRTVSLD